MLTKKVGDNSPLDKLYQQLIDNFRTHRHTPKSTYPKREADCICKYDVCASISKLARLPCGLLVSEALV